MLDGLLRDVRYACRQLRLSPAFASVAILTLALGIAGTTSIFSVVEGVLLRSLPYRDPGRLVALWATDSATGEDHGYVSFPDLQDWRRQAHRIDGLAAYDNWSPTLTRSGEAAERLAGASVSSRFFETLGTGAALGRTFGPGDGESGSARVAVLSYGLWQQRFGGSRDILGRTVPIAGQPYRVIGVLPRRFRFPPLRDAVVWRPLVVTPPRRNERGNHFLRVVARLAPGATQASAGREMSMIARRLASEHAESNTGVGVSVVSLREDIVGTVRPALLVLLGAVGLLLLIACVNIASLSLTRTLGRRDELAVRAALGAARSRLVRQVLVESAILALIAGAIGVVASVSAVHALVGLVPTELPGANAIGIDVPVLLVSVGVSLGAGLAAGVLPATWAGRVAGGAALREASGRHGATRSASRLRTGLVVAEIVLAVVLTIGAGLLLKSFAGLRTVDPGLAPDHLLTARLTLWPPSYRDKAVVRSFSDRLRQRLDAVPGVASATAVAGLPFRQDFDITIGFSVEGRPEPPPGGEPSAKLAVVLPGYFQTLGIPVLRGRPIADVDGHGSPPVAVINRTMAERYWPGRDPLGQRIELTGHTSGETPGARRIVGVVGDVRQYGLEAAAHPEIYVPQEQFPIAALTLAVRTRLDPTTLVPAVRRAVAGIDPDVPVSDIRTMDALVSGSVAGPRFNALAVGLFSALALALCGLGVYGVVAYGVRQRTREIGIRMAVGAGSPLILGLVMREALVLASVGIAVGIGLGLAAASVLRSLLYRVEPVDPAVYGLVAATVLGVTLAAALLPAVRATRVDPMAILRSE